MNKSRQKVAKAEGVKSKASAAKRICRRAKPTTAKITPPADPHKGRYVRAVELLDCGMEDADVIKAVNYEYARADTPFDVEDLSILRDIPSEA